MIYGTYLEYEGSNIHTECFICDVCKLPIEGNYLKDEWGNKMHEHHNNSEKIFCDSCGKILTNNKIRYDDERYVCSKCHEISIDSSEKAIKGLKNVINLLKEKGIKYNNPAIRVFLTSQNYINTNSDHIGVGKLRGLCKTQIIGNSLNHKIYILNGLPEIEYNGVLAHELLHAWMFENSIALSNDKCEGFCNLGSALVYKRSNTKLGNILFNNLENDKDPIYGNGFREMKRVLENKGWEFLIKYVKQININ